MSTLTQFLTLIALSSPLALANSKPQGSLDPSCGESKTKPKAFLQKAAAWNKHLLQWKENGAPADEVNAFRKRNGLPMTLWLSDGTPAKIRAQGVASEGPGGNALLSFQKSLPKVDAKGSLRSDRIFEFDAAGKVLHRWPFEAEKLPHRVVGDELVYERPFTSLCLKDAKAALQSTLTLAVRRDGSLRAIEELPEGEYDDMECPAAAKKAIASEFLKCRKYKDAQGKAHIIGFEAPMT